ncbi:ATP-binding protein [Streptomyces sp. NPDC127038]|uniref:ATP-binding protein n=1 Tax=Streptomyces sp. NPDC127038 TaxID=3347114 RepID=UPI0036524D1A
MTVATPPSSPATATTASPAAGRRLALQLPHGLHAPRIARRLTADWLADQGTLASCTSDVALIVSELVTNAVRHTHQPCTLTLTRRGSRLDIAVADHSRTPPHAPNTPGEHGGFGLRLIKGLGGRITTAPTLDGKTVHASVYVSPPIAAQHACRPPQFADLADAMIRQVEPG